MASADIPTPCWFEQYQHRHGCAHESQRSWFHFFLVNIHNCDCWVTVVVQGRVEGQWVIPPYTGRKSHCKQHKRTCGTLSCGNSRVTEGLYCTCSGKLPQKSLPKAGSRALWRRWLMAVGERFQFCTWKFLALCSITPIPYLTSAHSSLSDLLLGARCSRRHGCHSGTQEAEEARRSEIQGHLQLYTKFKTSLDYLRSCLKAFSTLENLNSSDFAYFFIYTFIYAY